MYCAACAHGVEEALRGVPGVTSASVNPVTEEAIVRAASGVGLDALRQAVEKAGYRVGMARPRRAALRGGRRPSGTESAGWLKRGGDGPLLGEWGHELPPPPARRPSWRATEDGPVGPASPAFTPFSQSGYTLRTGSGPACSRITLLGRSDAA